MSKYPTAEIEQQRYPSKYYRGYKLIRDPQEWNTRGMTVPIQRMPGYMHSSDEYEERYKIRRHKRRPKQKFLFHPFISDVFYPPKRGATIEWGLWE